MENKTNEKYLLKLVISAILGTHSTVSLSVDTAIKVDNTLVTAKDLSPAVNTAADVVIINGNDNGKIAGSNLFFSFSKFNLNALDTAKFSCNPCSSASGISNIISRIKDNQSSELDGALTVEASGKTIASNLWLFNPNGVVLGNGARVNVPGAFHLSNANGVEFKEDGSVVGTFDMNTNNVSALTISPSAFTKGGSSNNDLELNGADIKTGTNIEIYADSGENVTFLGNNTLTANGAGTITIKGGNLVIQDASTVSLVSGNGSTVRAVKGSAITGTGDITNAGRLTLKGKGSNQVKAGNDLILDGDGSSTGLIDIETQGNVTLTAKNNFKLGAANKGTIKKIDTATGDLAINAGTAGPVGSGGLSFTAGSSISDKSTSGDLNVTVNNGDLTVGPNDANISKSGGSGKFNVNVVAGSLTNSAEISGYANATGDLTNTGTIKGYAKASGNLNNTGAASSIQSYAEAKNGALTNEGAISGNATAGTSLNNVGSIGGKAVANGGALTNSGTIGSNQSTDFASAKGAVTNTGTINGYASAGTDTALADLNNGGTIKGYAKASGNLVNNGATSSIHGYAEATGGKLTNSGTIGGGAESADDIDNQATGIITGNVVSRRSNITNAGVINLNQTADFGKVIAEGNLVLDGTEGPGQINITNTNYGRVDIQAKGTLELKGNGSDPNSATQGVIEITGKGNGKTVISAGDSGSGGLSFSGNAWIHDISTGSADLNLVIKNDNLTANVTNLNKNGGSGRLNVTVDAGSLINSAEISGDAYARKDLDNSGTIGGNATAEDGALKNSGSIDGNATAGTDLTNDGQIAGQAKAATGKLSNHALISGDATAENGVLENSGSIDGNATAGASLDNSGGIGGKAVVNGGALTNSGTIGSNQSTDFASATGGITNTGTINGYASAGTDTALADLNNGGTIKGYAKASGNLKNTGGTSSIQGYAEAQNGALTNTGTINGYASAGTDTALADLNNDGTIQGYAKASGNLKNNGATSRIQGYAEAINGALTNQGAISGNATAGTNLDNSGSIGGKAVANGGVLTNSGTIGSNQSTDFASATGAVTNTGTINGYASAGTDTALADLNNGGTIKGYAKASGNLKNTDGTSSIQGYAEAINGALTNQGAISGNATAGTNLDNSGRIDGNAVANGGALTNSGTIGSNQSTDFASATGAVTNTGTINGYASAGTDTALANLNNGGTIKGYAKASGNLKNTGATSRIQGYAEAKNGALTNQGTIGLDATAKTALSNAGNIHGNATAGTNLTNDGQIAGQAKATTGKLINHASISGDATAGASLDNTGHIGGKAIASDGALNNSGTIGTDPFHDFATAKGALSNSGVINGYATAGTSLSSTGVASKINGYALAKNGGLTNEGAITAYAEAVGGDLRNSGSIGTNKVGHYAVATGHLINSGTIKGYVRTDGDLINNGTIAVETAGSGDAKKIHAGGKLENHGRIAIDGTGDASVNVGLDMIVSGSSAEVAFSNSGKAEIQVNGAALIDNGGKVSFANNGQAFVKVDGNLTLGLNGAGVIERTGSNIDDFIVDPIDFGSSLTVQNPGSKIVDSRPAGNLIISANDKISILNGGLISRELSTDSTSELNLYTQHLVMQGSKVFSSGLFNMAANPNVTIEQIQKRLVFPTDLTFMGSDSILKSSSDFGIDGNVFYTLPANGPYGNAVISMMGKLYLEPDNLQAIQRNGRNIGGPYLGNDLIGGSYNYFGNGFRSNQAGNLQSVNFGVISKPADLPEVPPDPCGSGNTLEIKHSSGVIPAWGDLVSFSVFPQEGRGEGLHEEENQASDESRANPGNRNNCN